MRSPGRGSRGKLRRPSYYPDPARSHRQLRLWLRIEWGIQAAYSEAKEEKCLGWSAPPRVSLLYTWCSDTQGVASVLDSSLEVASPQPPLPNTVLRGHLDMATFDALERLQKFDWLIQKLHNIRSTLQSDQGLQELQKLHALQLLQKSDFHFNGSSIGESEDDKMELCKNEGEEEEEEEVLDEEDEDDIIEDVYVKDEEQTLPLALTTSPPDDCKSLPLVQSPSKLNDDPHLTPPFPPTSLPSSFPPTSLPPPFPSTALPPPFPSSSPFPPVSPPAPPTKPSEAERRGYSPVRFPTGLFPPLPFEGMFPMLSEDAEIKVGSQFTKFYQSLLQVSWLLQCPVPTPVVSAAPSHPPPPPIQT